MRYLSVLLVLIPTPIFAQDEAPTYLESLLQDALSAEGREVRVTGFTGAWRSRAEVERLTIADTAGIWLDAQDLTLDWNRGALLKGALDIETLGARQITVHRPPLSPPSPPSPEAAGFDFTLPDLPVSVSLGSLSIDAVHLGAEILGEAVRFSAAGSAALVDGSGEATLAVNRLDSEGQIALAASYANDTRFLDITTTVREPKSGFLSELIGLHGAPSVDLTLEGHGPIDHFDAQLTLATDGTDRVAGALSLLRNEQTQSLGFEADLRGDLAALFVPDYRDFFGPDFRIQTTGHRAESGETVLSDFTVQAQSVQMSAALRLDPTGAPAFVQATGQLKGDAGPVLLPLSGVKTYVSAADFSVSLDQDRGHDWQLAATLDGLRRSEVDLNRLALSGTGSFVPKQQFTGVWSLEAGGVHFADPALARAAGQNLSGRLRTDWTVGQPFAIRDLALSAGNLNLNGDITLPLPRIEPDLTLKAADLSRFAALSALPLKGAGDLTLRGSLSPIEGIYDLKIEGQTQDLRLGQPYLDPLLQGRSTLDTAVRRDETGSFVDHLHLRNPNVALTANGWLSSTAGTLDLSARLSDLARLVPGISGPAELKATANRTGQGWQVTTKANAPAGTAVNGQGTIADDFATGDLTLDAQAPLALINPMIKPRTAQGTITAALRLDGPLTLDTLGGTASLRDGRLANPDVNIALEQIAATVAVSQARVAVDLQANVSSGGRLSASGPVSLTSGLEARLRAKLDQITLSDPALYRTRVDGSLTLSGPLTGGARIAGALRLGDTELRVPAGSGPSYADLPGLRHRNESAESQRVRSWAGLVETTAQATPPPDYALDLTIDAPSRIFVRGRGLDAELGGQLRLGGTTNAVVPQGQFDLIRGRMDILGKRLTLAQGLIQLQGALDPYIRFVAQTDAGTVTAQIVLEGLASAPDLIFTSVPELPQEEVFARLLFGRAFSAISPVQAVRLALAIRTLTGRGGDGLLGNLRQGLALDDFDVVTDDAGNTQARAGKYLNENIYTEVTADSAGRSQINLNLQLNPNVSARGRVSSTGETGIGIFIEKDY